ncbi:MAG: hypothetical protein AAFZ18_03115 [Myxococcota bacterium]
MSKPKPRADTLDESPTVMVSALATPLNRPSVGGERSFRHPRTTLRRALVSRAGTRPVRERFGADALGSLLLAARDASEVLSRAFACWARGFEIAGRFVVIDGDVLGAEVAGLRDPGPHRFRGARVPARRHWLLRDAVERKEPYVGEGSAEVGSTWLTDRLGLAPAARVALLPIQDARGEVVGLFVGNGARVHFSHQELQLMRAAIRAGHRLVQSREALERLAGRRG